MNTNQIPPGIIAMVCHTGHVVRQFGNNYAEWYNKYKDEYTIHTISVDGTQWSVGDNVQGMPPQNNKYKILGFKWKPELGWYIEVPMKGETSHILLSLVTKLPVKDSGGEESEFQKWNKQLSQRGNFTPTPINPSEPEERRIKVALIWEMIEDWQMSRESDEDINEPKFSYQDIEMDLYEWLEKVDPLAKPFNKDIKL